MAADLSICESSPSFSLIKRNRGDSSPLLLKKVLLQIDSFNRRCWVRYSYSFLSASCHSSLSDTNTPDEFTAAMATSDLDFIRSLSIVDRCFFMLPT